MKKILNIIAAALVVLTVGCSKDYDDSALVGRVDNLESRVSALEALCKQMNTNISSLQTIVDALQNADYITSVTPVTQNGVTIGYTITFAKNGSITIYHGTNGKDGQNGKDGADGKDGYTPVIGIRQDTDGLYYWTLDGEWLLDASGNKICAAGRDGRDGTDGKDGITPQLKIEDGYWYISYDNGTTWTQLGKATGEDGKDGTNGKDGVDGQPGADGDSMFRDVTQDELNVYLTLADGTMITIPKGVPLSITFDEEDLVVMSPNSMREIHYIVSSVIPDVEVEVVSSADIKAKVVAASAMTGAIEVKTGATIDEYSKVVVFVSNGEKVIMRRFAFEQTGLQIEDNATKEAAAEGGELVLEFLSNVECEVVIPESAQSWISVVPDTRAMEKRSITLKLEPNDGAARKAIVIVKSVDGSLSIEYTIEQDANKDVQLALEREALIAIYKALDGDNWAYNENWCSNKPVGEWCGVKTDYEGRVQVLWIDNNNISGKIPAAIKNLTKLESLWMENNQLEGSIPSEIGNLFNLQQLYLSDNQLIGSIPSEIGNLSEIQSIVLRNNQLSGDVPQSIQQAKWWSIFWIPILEGNKFDWSTVTIPAPKFSVRTVDDTLIDDSIYAQNKYTVLFYWADWCTAARQFTPILVELYERYRNYGVDVLGWTIATTLSTLQDVNDFISSYGIRWKNVYCDSSDSEHIPPMPALNFVPSVNVVDSDGKIVFNCLRDDFDELGAFLFEHLGVGEPVDYYVSTDYSQDGKVVTLQKATKGNGIDVVLMGDAYSDRQIADGTYMKAMQAMVDNLFSEEPYKSFKDMFNVYVVNVVSATEGYEYGNTALSGFFGYGTQVGGNDNRCFSYALNAISEERMDEALIVVAMNEDAYAGTCYMYYPTTVTGTYGSGPSVAYFPTSSDTATLSGLVLHEAGGHGFSKLADEYDYGTTVSAEEVNATKAQQNDWGWWKNVDFTGAPSAVRWNYFLSDYRYANDGLGVFEGGLTHSFGVWRPTENSIMRYNTGGFNAPSREAIYYRIHKLAYGDSWQYNYEDFVKYDEINRKAAASARVYAPSTYKPTHPPVVVNKSWRDAK